jgi:hypothetical protein
VCCQNHKKCISTLCVCACMCKIKFFFNIKTRSVAHLLFFGTRNFEDEGPDRVAAEAVAIAD